MGEKVNKVNFTAGRVADFQCEAGKQQSFHWDAKTPGLGVRVTKAGAKSYIFESRVHGQTLRVTIGKVEKMAVGNAQAEARRLQGLIDAGTDPREAAREQEAAAAAKRRESQRKRVTVGEAWAVYVESRRSRWSERHYHDHLCIASAGGAEKKRGAGKTAAGPLASLMPRKLSELDGAAVTAWLDAETQTRPTKAAHAYRLLRAFIRWTDDMPDYRGLASPEAYNAKAVKEAVPRSNAKEGDSLQREQLADWFEAVRRLRNPVFAAYLQALLITGARREEMAGLAWDDVDFRWRSITIRDKVEGTRTIPLPPYLAGLLAALPRRNKWVFSSPAAEDGKIAEPRIPHNEALAAAGLPHVTLHGLRRSFGTLCEWVEMPSGISAQIMGHKPSALAEKHYRRRPLDLLRMWHDKIEAWMLEQAGVEFDPAQQDKGLRLVKGNTAA